MVNALASVDGVELVGELQCLAGQCKNSQHGTAQLTTLEYLELKKVCHKFYTIKRAFQGGNASPAEAHAAIVKQICQYTLSAFSVCAMIVVLRTSDCAKCLVAVNFLQTVLYSQ